jgi:predicted Fe-S protein YdhL (DUF1289 family)
VTESPCNKVCVLDRVTGWCIGCGRTGEEIGAWIGMTEAERAALVARLPARLAAMTTREVRGGRRARSAAR